ncbi:tripartite tricarboxylate transporter substrate binding protein [Variovorax sp. J22P240]|uniref:Bug family tripartite tricarboxylate transporter substrate binding protein n=1 Tax=Variovorax sp. J22P240 TaxID=3053514 RepID=UPI002575243A|nr:tripartite tricarboxylate transporter substrate binding protein [Variovorax sp. J22P240]MDL9999996.1 tripartite tricarboxylate transporter substrate binding protein [Variovorax sp. J22P240]
MTFLQRLLAAVWICTAAVAASAQPSYPTKPIRMVIPLAAGSAVDNGARVLTQKMGVELGQPFVLENIPGSSGLIGADRVAHAAPDGYTIGGFNDSVLTMIPHIYPKAGWDALTDFAPISLVGTIEWGLVVPPDSPLRTVEDFIKAAKASPGKLNYGSGGSGSPQHIAMAMFASRAGINVTHVPYKGATPAAVAVAGGEVDAAFQGLGTVTSLIQGGKLRLLAVSTSKRLPQYPNVPTVAESGLPDFYFNSWFAMVAPKGTPKEIIDRLHAAMRSALDDPDTNAKLVGLGITVRGTSPEDFGRAIGEQYALYRKVIQANNIKAD